MAPQRVLHGDGVGFAVVPVPQMGRRVFQCPFDQAGEEVVPVAEGRRQPGRGLPGDQLFARKGAFAPVVQGCAVAGFGPQHRRPERPVDARDQRRGGRVDGEYAVPGAEQVGRLACPFRRCRGVVDAVCQALRDLLVHLGVDVGLKCQHIRRGELSLAAEPVPDALVAVGRGPVKRELVGVAVGRHPRVGGRDDAALRIERGRQRFKWDGAGPLAGRVAGRDGHGLQAAGADRDESDGLVAGMARVVGIDDIERGCPPGGKRRAKARPVRS